MIQASMCILAWLGSNLRKSVKMAKNLRGKSGGNARVRESERPYLRTSTHNTINLEDASPCTLLLGWILMGSLIALLP